MGERIIGWFVLVCLVTAPAAAGERVKLDTRPGVTVAMYAGAAERARATLVMLPGGNGRVKVDRHGAIENDTNFVVRTRRLFEAAGYNLLLPDSPSDRGADGLGGEEEGSGYRLSPDHMADLAKIVAFARQRYGKPVVMIGFSRGSISLAAYMTAHPGTVDAAAFVSSVVSGKLDGGLNKADLSGIAGPVLFLHHRKDACKVSKPKAVEKAAGKFAATVPSIVWIDGPGLADSRECGPFHYHGFEKQEQEAVRAIADWIAGSVK